MPPNLVPCQLHVKPQRWQRVHAHRYTTHTPVGNGYGTVHRSLTQTDSVCSPCDTEQQQHTSYTSVPTMPLRCQAGWHGPVCHTQCSSPCSLGVVRHVLLLFKVEPVQGCKLPGQGLPCDCINLTVSFVGNLHWEPAAVLLAHGLEAGGTGSRLNSRSSRAAEVQPC